MADNPVQDAPALNPLDFIPGAIREARELFIVMWDRSPALTCAVIAAAFATIWLKMLTPQAVRSTEREADRREREAYNGRKRRRRNPQ